MEQTAQRLTLMMELDGPWPGKGRVSQEIALRENALTLRLESESDSDTFPASAGWHPWFAKWVNTPQDVSDLPLQEALQVSFSADWQEDPGDNELPTGRRISPRPGPWDDCFGFKAGVTARLEWPGKVALVMTSAAPGLVVFDKQPDATCVNPMTQAPNAINLSPECVSPQTPLVIETRWQFQAP